MSKLRLFLLACCVTLGLCGAASAAEANPPSVASTVPSMVGSNMCERLATPNLADAHGTPVDFAAIPDAPSHIISAKVVPANGDVPAYCYATGYVAPAVGFELRLPTTWNGKFAMVGCGGMCGGMQAPGCDTALVKGYACIMSDMGHKGTQIDAEWAFNNLQAAVDFGYRATHVAAVAGKYITAVFYGQKPKLSYFFGCSTGGRQGYVEAQRFPDDFNGILAGSPPMSETGDGLDILWAIKATENADGTPLLKAKDILLVNHAVVKQCDMNDGVKDGVIGDPRLCKFDPASLVCKAGQTGDCLTLAQADAVKKIYAGPHNAAGQRWYYGVMPGSETNWIGSLQRDDGQRSTYKAFMTSMFRFLNFAPSAGPGWTMAQFDWERDPPRLDSMEALFTAGNPDMHRFKAAGGKLISFQGWNDHIVQAEAVTDYYDKAERTMGGRAETQDFYRLFMVPGLNHCQGGTGAYAVDWTGALEDWVERGKAPDQILSVRPQDPTGGLYPRFFTPAPGVMANAIFSRPLYPYPARAVYSGKGDPTQASSYKAVQ